MITLDINKRHVNLNNTNNGLDDGSTSLLAAQQGIITMNLQDYKDVQIFAQV